jgi:hypothetical protein
LVLTSRGASSRGRQYTRAAVECQQMRGLKPTLSQ